MPVASFWAVHDDATQQGKLSVQFSVDEDLQGWPIGPPQPELSQPLSCDSQSARTGDLRRMTIVARTAYCFEDLQLGMETSVARTVSEADILAFAEVTGDKNPVHLDAAYAAGTMFKERIAHGMLSAGYISAVFGMELPGPGAIYLSQTLNFRAPVKIGDTVIAKVKVVELAAKRRARFECVCSVEGKTVLDGEAVLMVPGRK